MSTTLCEAIAAEVSSLGMADLPASVLTRARLQAASVLAAALGSAREAGVLKVLQGLRGRLGRTEARLSPRAPLTGESRLLPTGEPMPVHEAVLGSAAASCAFDWDEILLLGHPGHSSVGVSFCLGQALGASLGDVLTAQVLANEVAGRFGLACFFGPQNGQHLPFVHHAGAAVSAARLLGLDAEATADALAIALGQPQTALWPAFLGDIDSKVLTAAHPAELGLAAAEHAAAGVRGPRGILDHPRGFLHRFSFLPAPNALTGFGRAWVTHTLQTKAHAACWYFQAPLSALATLRSRAEAERGRPPAPEEVRSLSCESTALAMAVHGLASQASESDALRPNTVNFRLDYSLGLLFLHGRLTPMEMGEAGLTRDAPALRTLASRTRIRHGLEHTQEQLLAVHRALDVPALLGHPGPLALSKALARARREFPGVAPRLAGGSAGRTLLGLLGALVAVRRGSRADRVMGRDQGARYDLGDHATALEALALPSGATVSLALTDGWEGTERLRVPQGYLGAPDIDALIERKVAQAFESSGRTHSEAHGTRAFHALRDAPLDTPVGAVLDAWFGSEP